MTRLLDTFTDPNGASAKIYFDADYEGFVVKFFNYLGDHMDASDYFASDKDDAYATAKYEMERH